jgi:hypothetical protein
MSQPHGSSPEVHPSRQDEGSQRAGKCACDAQKQLRFRIRSAWGRAPVRGLWQR